MKWKWSYLYMAIGGTFVVKMIENGRINALLQEARDIRAATRKPILLVSTKRREGFDTYIDPRQTNTWHLPYLAKSFGCIASDSLEDIPYPREAIVEWERVADKVLIHTHSLLSPEAWLDWHHHQVFWGDHIIPVNPALNWAIGGSLGYYLYRRHQRQLAQKTPKAIPDATAIMEEITTAEPPASVLEAEELPERKALPAPIDGVEPAPEINPDDLEMIEPPAAPPPAKMSGALQPLDGIDLTAGVNLGIGSDETLSQQLAEQGVTNLIFNPQMLPQEHNQAIIEQLAGNPADSATLINVLSQVKDPQERQGAVQIAQENVRRGGRVFIKDKNVKKYLPEVKQVFPNAKLKGKVIIATN